MTRPAQHGAAGYRTSGQPPPTAAGTPPAAPGGVLLTPAGRRLLAQRAAWLEAERIPELAAGREGGEQDDWTEGEYRRAVAELDRLRAVLEHAGSTHDVPEVPGTVQLGDVVLVDLGGGQAEHFLLVHPVEAPLDEVRVSSESPLGKAVLGRRVGEQVDVDAPAGSYRCRIVATHRHAEVPAP